MEILYFNWVGEFEYYNKNGTNGVSLEENKLLLIPIPYEISVELKTSV
jgi:hypothetical protein